jgi:hypothetical protein
MPENLNYLAMIYDLAGSSSPAIVAVRPNLVWTWNGALLLFARCASGDVGRGLPLAGARAARLEHLSQRVVDEQPVPPRAASRLAVMFPKTSRQPRRPFETAS